MNRPYQICVRCVMDTTDPDITFDDRGVCNHCHAYDAMVRAEVFTGEDGQQRLLRMVDAIKEEGAGNKYDCIIGVSGGVDSTYVAYLVKKYGLRPLAVHFDNGWDSELAVSNIHKALNILGIDLHTHVIDWEEFRDLQLSFLKASTPDSEIPSDHAIVSLMYQMADELKIKYVISGRNVRTETHVAAAWSNGHFDWKYITSVHAMFGKAPLKTYPHRTIQEEERYRRTQVWFDILNYVDFVKKDAMKTLEQELGWKYYGGKHYESIYTRFFQGYILPYKFGYDKRRGHLSSLICSREITRSEALSELEKPTYPPALQEEDREYVVKKLGLTDAEFEAIMQLPKKNILDYPSYARDNLDPLLKMKGQLYALPRIIKKIIKKRLLRQA
ncbi:MAG: N-acetyl sugar amidotransferase [Anaerolineales bacterium]|nr:N-acetyl sugar amidotransferase [Anaerolineales bacterium]